MAQYKAYSEDVEVNGQTVRTIIAGMGKFHTQALQILEKNGIYDPQPNRWYSQQSWLDAFKAIADALGDRTLFQIGKKIPENAIFPHETMHNIEDGLKSIDIAYHMNHRGGEIGHYTYESTGTHSGKMICSNPYPSEFDRGIIEAIAKMYVSEEAKVAVKRDANAPTRLNGDDSCTFLVSWSD